LRSDRERDDTVGRCVATRSFGSICDGHRKPTGYERYICQYAEREGVALAPKVLLGLLFFGYATGAFSSRKIERVVGESIPFRFVAGGLHPDHDTIANFRKSFLPEIQELFVEVFLLAQTAGVFKMGNLNIDGNKIHVDDLAWCNGVNYSCEVCEAGKENYRPSEKDLQIPSGLLCKS